MIETVNMVFEKIKETYKSLCNIQTKIAKRVDAVMKQAA
jgi:hypothetical protein